MMSASGTAVLTAVPEALASGFPIAERLAATRAAYREREPTSAMTAIPHGRARGQRHSQAYTIVEVGATDRIGLLYAITSALHWLALDIHLAKVGTLGHEVVDAFYVLRKNGRRVEQPDEIERLERRVIAAVAALDAPG